MRRGLQKNILAGLMSFALVVPSSGIFALADSQKVSAEEDKNTVLTKILGAEDISLRMKWNDKSNIGEEHTVTLSNGSTIKVKDNGTMRKEMTAQQLALHIIQNIEKAFPIEMCGIDGYPETLRLPYDRLAAFGQSFGRACFCSARQGIVVVPGKPRIQKRNFAQKIQRLLSEKVCVLECKTGKLFGNGAYEIL